MSKNIWPYTSPGVPDELFERLEGVPMTKSEIRAVIISRLRLFPGAVVYDVGAGSGSVAVEAALQGGNVLALERDKDALALIKSNAGKFGVNLDVIAGEAASLIDSLPRPHRIFIGGSGGKMTEILEACHRKLYPGGYLVMAGVTVENPALTYRFLQEKGYQLEALQIQGALARPLKDKTAIWQGRNPVTVVSGQKGEQ